MKRMFFSRFHSIPTGIRLLSGSPITTQGHRQYHWKYCARIMGGYNNTMDDNRRCWSTSSSGSSGGEQLNQQQKNDKKRRVDPMTRRPNQKCDPYGMNGKPMDWEQAQELMGTLEEPWNIRSDHHHENISLKLVREYHHDSYMDASKFVTILAAIATQHNHYPPNLTLQRKLGKKEWIITTTVECFTPTLQGLSFHDFHIAMMIDDHTTRPHIQSLLTSQQNTPKNNNNNNNNKTTNDNNESA